MADTYGAIVRDALIEIGAKSAGEALDADESADSFRRLQGMFDEWGLEGLLVPGLRRLEYTFTETAGVVTIGPDAADDADDPDIITADNVEQISSLNYLRLGQEQSRPLDPTNYSTLSEIRRVNGSWPRQYFYEQSHPVARLHFDASMERGDYIEFTGRGHFSGNIAIDDDPSDILPRGYREAVLLNLAVKLGPSYGAKDGNSSGLSMETKSAAKKGKSLIQNRNLQVVESKIDPALVNYSSSLLRRTEVYR